MAEANQVASPKLTSATGPLVGLIMGSDPGWPIMEPIAEVLAEFGILFEVGMASAHRIPERMIDYVKSVADKGPRCIIAGVGGAAYLLGMVASATPLPVVGMPYAPENLEGIDPLLSIVQMLGGVSMATVGVGGAKDVGLLAVRILSISYPKLTVAMESYQTNMRDEVLVKDERLRKKLMGE